MIIDLQSNYISEIKEDDFKGLHRLYVRQNWLILHIVVNIVKHSVGLQRLLSLKATCQQLSIPTIQLDTRLIMTMRRDNV